MALEITPTWARGHSVTLALCAQRRELTLTAPGEVCQYVLVPAQRPDRLGWTERRLHDGPAARRAVTVSEVVRACLQEWDAEEAVLELTAKAAQRAAQRGGNWKPAAKRLRAQARLARQRRRVSLLPLQVLWHQRSDPRRGEALSPSLAAERIGYVADGRPDATRLLRRLGVAGQDDKTGAQTRQRAVSYDTAIALCEALGVDAVEVGL